MAGKPNKKTTRHRKRPPIGALIALPLCVVLLAMLLWMAFTARILHVRHAEVYLRNLPAAFDGTTVLYATDLDLCGLNTVRNAAAVFERLQSLNPDLLLLGGDYASATLIERMNNHTSAEESNVRSALFQILSGFRAPLGKLVILGADDGTPDALRDAVSGTTFAMIDGTAYPIARDGATLYIAGIGTATDNVGAIASSLDRDACVIALASAPDQVIDVRVAEAKGGGPWADLILAGHTHGGQLRVGNRTVLSLTETEKRYPAGWYFDGDAPLLVSQGMGCEALNLRWNTQAEVWLLTLHPKVDVQPFLTTDS